MRVEVLIDQEAKIPAKTLAALRNQIESKLNPVVERYTLRIATSTMSSVSITGVKSKDQQQIISDILQGVWEDDSWLPE